MSSLLASAPTPLRARGRSPSRRVFLAEAAALAAAVAALLLAPRGAVAWVASVALLALASWAALAVARLRVSERLLRRSLRGAGLAKAAALRDARGLRQRVVDLELEKARYEALLHSAMDPAVARRILERRHRNEKRQVSVLFADVQGFTAHAEDKAPEAVILELNRLFSTLEPALTRFRGHLDKYLGDGLMAEFGYPHAAGRHAPLAVLAGLEMQQALAARDLPWKLRVGIATGQAIVGLVGSTRRQNLTAIGDTVNLASRLQTLCPPGSVCVDQATAALVERWFRLRPLREGASREELRAAEARLELLQAAAAQAPDARTFLAAARAAGAVGDAPRAAQLYRQAAASDPSLRETVAGELAATLAESARRAEVPVKGRRQHVGAYEVAGPRDPLDSARIPARAARLFWELSTRVRLPEETLSAIEAPEGAIGHARATAALAAALAEELGAGEEEVHLALLAGFLHDVGKRDVPEQLLGCEERLETLSPAEAELIRGHVRSARGVLAELGVPAVPGLLDAIEQHHEECDGSGYPAGLKGPEICLAARIVRVADSFESLSAWRPHREPWDPAAALGEIQREAREGRADPRVAAALQRLLPP